MKNIFDSEEKSLEKTQLPDKGILLQKIIIFKELDKSFFSARPYSFERLKRLSPVMFSS